jgi:predicted small metal-binding protein
MKKVTCPPCGAEFKSHSDDELVALVQNHAKVFHRHDLSRDHILQEAIVVGGEPALKTVVCPPCGAEFKTHNDDELVEMVQQHAKAAHGKTLPREEILKVARVV